MFTGYFPTCVFNLFLCWKVHLNHVSLKHNVLQCVQKIYTLNVKIENNHRSSGMISLNFIIILMLNFTFAPESRAYNPPLSVKIDNVTCYGKSNGSIEIITSEEISEAFNIEVRSNSTGTLGTFNENSPRPFQINDLKAGDYTIWCTQSTSRDKFSITIESPEILKANVINIESINGENESLRATLKTNPTGGTPPYSISWSENTNNQQGAIATNLPMGIYRSNINDSNNCGPVSSTYFLVESEVEKYLKNK